MIDTSALKKKIIDLAVIGKLTSSSTGDANTELLDIISALHNEKQRQILSKEKWADIPANWTWCRLSDLTTSESLNDGDWVLKKDMVSNGEVKLIQLGSIGDCEYRNKGFKYLTKKHFEELNGTQIFPGYLLINRLVVDKMVSCILPDIEGILITAVDVCWVAPNEELYSIEYLMYVLASSGVQQKVKALGHGVTRFRISKLNLIDIAFPLPPVEEQKQIVKKVKELFNCLNNIDQLQNRYQLDYASLKDKIIEAGIKGNLTEQLLEDGDAEDLFRSIQEERITLIKEGRIKKSKASPAIVGDEIPFDIPNNWKWVRFADLYRLSNGVASRGSQGGTPHPVLRLADLTSGVIDTSDVRKISLTDAEYESHKIQKNDLIFIRVNGSRGRVANAYLYYEEEDISYCDHLFCGHKISDRIEPTYIMLVFNSEMIKRQIDPLIKTTAGQNTINQGSMGKMVIPLPPQEEQKRIVAKVNELFSALPEA